MVRTSHWSDCYSDRVLEIHRMDFNTKLHMRAIKKNHPQQRTI